MDARERAPPPQLRPFSGGVRQAAEAERQATRYGPGRTAERTRADDGPYESMTRGLNHAWCNSQCPGCDGGSGNRGGGGGGGGGGGVHCDYGHTPSEHRNTSKYTNTKRVQILYTISFRSISGLISFLSFLSLSLPTRILKSENSERCGVNATWVCPLQVVTRENILCSLQSAQHNSTTTQHARSPHAATTHRHPNGTSHDSGRHMYPCTCHPVHESRRPSSRRVSLAKDLRASQKTVMRAKHA